MILLGNNVCASAAATTMHPTRAATATARPHAIVHQHSSTQGNAENLCRVLLLQAAQQMFVPTNLETTGTGGSSADDEGMFLQGTLQHATTAAA
jgi:hypothetical protein